MANEAVAGCIQNIVAPIIFIPGVMGSRLKDAKDKIIWNPGADDWEQISNAAGLASSYAADKRSLLIVTEI